MIWKNEAVSRLKAYQAKKLALENIPMEIRQQVLALSSIRSADPDSAPVRGNSTREDAMLNNMVYTSSVRQEVKVTGSRPGRSEPGRTDPSGTVLYLCGTQGG